MNKHLNAYNCVEKHERLCKYEHKNHISLSTFKKFLSTHLQTSEYKCKYGNIHFNADI
jgi:hypothetical protein